ncbi:MAG: condensation domain-containing protein, partial [Hyphomicrobiales bacterium]
MRALPDPEVVGEDEYRAPITATEVFLCDLYADLTGARRVGLDDSFFALGGDSITSIRLVSRARQAGIVFSVRDVFAHPTVGGLARVAQASLGVAKEIAAPSPGYVALTPIERQFLGEGDRLARFHQAIAVEVPVGITREHVESALNDLITHHDALRLRVVLGKSTPDYAYAIDASNDMTAIRVDLSVSDDVRLWLAPQHAYRLSLDVLDISHLSQEVGAIQIKAAVRDLPGQLAPVQGRMVAGVWVERSKAGASSDRPLLLLAIHHLSVDGVSWRILLEDLEHRTSGRVLPARTHSIRDWSDYLVRESHSQQRQTELMIWRDVVKDSVALPCDDQISEEENLIGSARYYESRLSSHVLEQLLSATPVYKAGIDDFLLTALGLALYGWRRDYYGLRGTISSAPLLVDLEGHGRESDASHLDLTRTVGWFTSIYPVRIDFDEIDLDEALQGGASAGLALRAMKEELRRTSDRGLGYGILRWLNEETGRELSGLPQAQIVFNYLGRFEGSGEGNKKLDGWRLFETGLVGGEDDQGRRRHHLIEVNAAIDGSGSLAINWGYHPQAHAQSAIVDLASRFNGALETLARHCHEAPLRQKLTPSDFPLAKKAGLDQGLLDQLAVEPDFEDILPLTPLQQGLAYESWSQGEDRAADPYHVQIALELDGVLDIERLRAAFERVVSRHQILRLTLPFSTIECGVGLYRSLPIDWRVETSQGRGLEAILKEDHAEAFDLGQGPLIRARVIKHDDVHHTLIISNHHVVLDGWSMPVLMSDLTAGYRGETLPPVIEWREHLAWLFKRERNKSLSYWRDHFSGAEGSNALPLAAPNTPVVGMGEYIVTLPADLTRNIEAFVRHNGLTLSTVFEGAFMLLLARLSGRSEVTIGVTRNGRSAEREDIDRAIGLYIGTLPLRAEVSLGAGLVEWLKNLQQEQAEQEEHSHISLIDIQRCANIHGGHRDRSVNLFEALFDYENYPVDVNVHKFSPELRIGLIRGQAGTHYPFSIIVLPGRQARIRYMFDRMVVDEAAVVSFGDQLSLLLEKFTHTQAHDRLGDLTVISASDRHKVIEAFNETAHVLPSLTLPELFAAQVEKTPDAIAVVFEHEEISYRELDARANQLARYLIAEKIGPEDIVAIALDRSIEMVVSLLGVLKSGAAYLPLDPDYPVER